MRYLSRRSLGLVVTAAVVTVAASLAFATGGRAASPNICLRPSTVEPSTGRLTAASCVTELVAPHFITAGSDAISVTKFTNESNGGATATHTVVSATFPTATGATIKLVNGLSLAAALAAGCSQSTVAATLTSPGSMTISCPYGSVTGTVKLTLRFSAGTTMEVKGTANYGESGNDNLTGPNGGINDRQANYDTLTVSSNAGGGCFDTVPPLQTGTTGVQATSALVGAATDTTLPCTFVDAGVLDKAVSVKHGAANTQVSFVEFPFLPAGTFGTVKIFFTPLPAGVNLNKLLLLEDTSYPAPFATSGFFVTFVTVPDCNKDASGTIPGTNGTPARGATDAVPHANDSCIFNRSSLPKGGGEIDMHVLGSPFDGHYQG